MTAVPSRMPASLLGLVAVFIFCAAISITRGSLDFFDDAKAGMLFNDMALRLLEGRFDVTPEVIRDEAFVHAGRSYSYQGIWPALLRMPLRPLLDLEQVQLSRLSCFIAVVVAMLAQVVAILRAVRMAGPAAWDQGLAMPFLFAAALSGPGTYLGPRPLIYHESILWAWAWAAVFIAAVSQALFRDHGRFGTRTLLVMAGAAGLCMLTRSSTGLGLYVALALVLVLEAGRRWKDHGGGVTAVLGLLGPGLVAATLAGAVLAVNYARWGNPLDFGDLRLQTLMEDLPHRLAVVADHGAFSLHRLWLGLGYYLAPLWAIVWDGRFLFADRSHELYWAVEGPPSSLLVMEPFSLAMAALGVRALWRRESGDRPAAIAALAGLAVPAVLIVLFLYLAFRYRAEFSPLLLLLGLIGLHAQAQRPGQAVRQGLWWSLLAVQLAVTQVFTFLYKIAPLGPPVGVETMGWVQYYLRAWQDLG